MIKAGQGAGPSLGIQRLAERKGTGQELSEPLLLPPPTLGRVTLEVGHLGILVFSIIRRARQEAVGSAVPCDPCQEMEPQGAEYRRGLWLEEVGGSWPAHSPAAGGQGARCPPARPGETGESLPLPGRGLGQLNSPYESYFFLSYKGAGRGTSEG